MGKFYSINDSSEQHHEDSDRHYAELLNSYGDANEWRRNQQQQSKELEVKIKFRNFFFI